MKILLATETDALKDYQKDMFKSEALAPPLLRAMRGDGVVFCLILGAMVWTVPRLRVYYTATPYQVALRAVDAQGVKTSKDLPPSLVGYHRRYHIVQKVQDFSRGSEAEKITPLNGSLEWTLQYSRNSLRFDQEEVIRTNQTLKEEKN